MNEKMDSYGWLDIKKALMRRADVYKSRISSKNKIKKVQSRLTYDIRG